jgi:hypothetical protein
MGEGAGEGVSGIWRIIWVKDMGIQAFHLGMEKLVHGIFRGPDFSRIEGSPRGVPGTQRQRWVSLAVR